MNNRDFLGMFKNKKPILGMLHLKGTTVQDTFERMKKELNIYIESGIDAVIVEDYFGQYSDMENALDYIQTNNIPIPYGVNCLNIDQMGFELAKKYNANFVQLDSVIGHVKPRDEQTLEAFFEMNRKAYSGCILGGVRFKYQPVLSENTLEQDLQLSKSRCDAVCVTGAATGEQTSTSKIQEFKSFLNNFPLIVGAGVTPNNMADAFKYADGAIIGSYFKKDHQAENEMEKANVLEIVDQVNKIREGIEQ